MIEYRRDNSTKRTINTMIAGGETSWFIECECGCLLHSIRIVVDADDGMLSIETHLNPYLAWWNRLKLGIKYIFGLAPNKCHYDNTILRDVDIKNLQFLFKLSREIKEKVAKRAKHDETR